MSKLRRSMELLRETGPVTFLSIAVNTSANLWNQFLLNKRHNVSIDSSADVDRAAMFGTDGTISVGPDCRIREYAKVLPSGGHVSIGADSLVNMFTILFGHGGLDIGESVLVGPQTTIVASNHIFERRDVPIKSQGYSMEGITIEDDVWIGANCVILDGVRLGKGTVVAAGSVVGDSFPEYSVVAGVPGKKIDTR